MNPIIITTTCKKIPADLYTPVGIYLRMRDKFRDTILLECTDSHAGENSQSIIAINAIAGIEIDNYSYGEFKLPNQKVEQLSLTTSSNIAEILGDFLSKFQISPTPEKVSTLAQGLFGYSSYDAVRFFEKIDLAKHPNKETDIPNMRYRLYQYVLVINHFKDEIYLLENKIDGIDSNAVYIESILKSKDAPVFPFKAIGSEVATCTDADYLKSVAEGIAACKRGDVFQIVLSRSFEQTFTGDEFNVYRALRSINPGPYLFYFDYGDYKLMGSSPESQLHVENNIATVHPIAGTFKRTGNDEADKALALALENDEKENAEHIMLVDLARNDLSKVCKNVTVSSFKNIQYYSHVIHMVSQVQGSIEQIKNPFSILANVFPAGTLTGAPKYKAMQLIHQIENSNRGFYGGTIGYMGFNNSCNHAIMIRSFLCKNNTLTYRAGAGIVAISKPENELQEVNNKLSALKNAIQLAENIV